MTVILQQTGLISWGGGMRLCIGGQGNGKAIPELPATLPNAVLSFVVNTYLAIP